MIFLTKYVEDATLATNWMFLEIVLKRTLKILTLDAANLMIKAVVSNVPSDFTLVIMADVLQFLQSVPISMFLKDTVSNVIQDID